MSDEMPDESPKKSANRRIIAYVGNTIENIFYMETQ